MGVDFSARNTTAMLLVCVGGVLGMTQPIRAISESPVVYSETAQSQIAQAQRPSMTWRGYAAFMTSNYDEFYGSMLPQSFPNGFANGQVAVTAMHTGRAAYIVAREGVVIPNLSTVRQQIGNNISFNTLGITPGTPFDHLPAVSTFPDRQYSGSNIIEVSHYAARHDDATLRDRARRSRHQMLPNGQRAYYMAPDGERIGWCTFQDEREQYSHFLCVYIANSPQTAFGVLSSIIRNPVNAY
jgi:hypothetical protein